MNAEGGPPRDRAPPLSRLRVLSELTRMFAEETEDPTRLLQLVVEQTSRFIDGLCILGVVTNDGTGWELLAEFADNAALLRERARDLPRGVQSLAAPTVIAQVINEGRSVRIADLRTSEWLAKLPPVLAAQVVRYNMAEMVAVPLRTRGRVIGAISITRHGPSPQPLLDDDLDLLGVLADHAAQAIACARLLASTRRELEEHKQTRASLERSQAMLQQAAKMEAVGRLAGGVAHDFNNVMSVILSHAEVLLDSVTDPQGREDLEEISQAAQRAARLTRQLLAFGRKQALAPRVLDLNRVLTDVEPMLRRLVGEDATISLSPDPELWLCRADPTQIEQVVVNLVINARDAMPQGGVITIATRNVIRNEQQETLAPDEPPGPYAQLTVSDAGTGMPPEVLERIFEPFFTTKPIGSGTGLGLATVHGIVKQSGGSIAVDSQPGVGTSFRVYFPRADAQADEPHTSAPPPEARGGSETLLLLEDDEQLLRVVRRSLSQAGYRVLVAKGVAAALELCRHHPEAVSLVLTDVVLPDGNGPDLAQRLLELVPSLKVLYMSGYTDEALALRGLTPGADFIAKPFTPSALLAKVRSVLG
jgi:signal transduction histidine kinase